MYVDADGNDLNQTKTVVLRDEAYLTAASELTLDGETIADAIKRIIYTLGVN